MKEKSRSTIRFYAFQTNKGEKRIKKVKKYSQLKQRVKTLKSGVHGKYNNKMINKSQSQETTFFWCSQRLAVEFFKSSTFCYQEETHITVTNTESLKGMQANTNQKETEMAKAETDKFNFKKKVLLEVN